MRKKFSMKNILDAAFVVVTLTVFIALYIKLHSTPETLQSVNASQVRELLIESFDSGELTYDVMDFPNGDQWVVIRKGLDELTYKFPNEDN
jgi:hypothetical protein